jgi:hypothetical protein
MWPTVLYNSIPAESIPLTPLMFTSNREEPLLPGNTCTCSTPRVVFAGSCLFSLGCLVVKSRTSLPILPDSLLFAPVA